MIKGHRFAMKPDDVLYFGQPSSMPAGESHHGQSFFPPPISAFQGMVRSRLLADSGLDLTDRSQTQRDAIAALVGPSDALPSEWQLRGPLPAVAIEGRLMPYLPTPLFVQRTKDEHLPGSTPRAVLLGPLPEAATRGLSSSSHPPGSRSPVALGAPGYGRLQPAGGWLGADGVLQALKGKAPSLLTSDPPGMTHRTGPNASPPLPPGFRWELRPGLAISQDTGVAQDGMLYFLRSVRLAPEACLLGWLDGSIGAPLSTRSLSQGTLNVGRKGRPMAFQSPHPMHEDWDALNRGDHLPTDVKEGEHFWLYLASPLNLAPDAVARPAIPSTEPDVTFEVVSAIVGKPQWFGGFSIATGRARENRPYVPAGSVWLFKVRGGDNAARRRALGALNASTPLATPERGAFGEGLTFVGRVAAPIGGSL